MPNDQYRARVITCSDAASRGERTDESGRAVSSRLEREGYAVDDVIIVPDDRQQIAQALIDAIDRDHCSLVVTTGGTGIGPRDVTPEAATEVIEKKLDGFGELMRAESLKKTRMAPLSRAQAGSRGSALIVNLPGSPKGAVENLEAILHLVPHALELLKSKKVEKHPE